MEHKFEPYQKVLARDTIGGVWRAKFFSNYSDDNKFVCTDDMVWEMCVHYEGNDHLLGTRNNPEQKFKFGQKVRVWDDKEDEKINAIFHKYLKGEPYKYIALCKDNMTTTSWKHCEAFEW